MEYNVIIVGSGPAGLGCSQALERAGIDKVLILEANTVGSSFRKWPQQMRLITPSFYGNPFYCTDLNGITPHESPADYSQNEHISGSEYADYLQAIATHHRLNIKENERVLQLTPVGKGYTVKTVKSTYRAHAVIWAAGEFSLPKSGAFDGTEHCVHSSFFRDWNDYQGKEAIVIGGYESGIDTACHLAKLGKRVLVLSKGEPWNLEHADPSETLSPYSRERLNDALERHPKRFILRGNSTVVSVKQSATGYLVETVGGKVYESSHRPIAATGYHSALKPIKELWEWNGSVPNFTDDDASTLHPGLYYSGPSLMHRDSKFCFIYKFRARFGVIARSIAKRIAYPELDTEDERRRGFLIDDLECCTNCECASEPPPKLKAQLIT
jgi:cation diffusion facilitator CzcD-associated flavoprotein CzcO